MNKIFKIITSVLLLGILATLFVFAFDPWERADKKIDEENDGFIRGVASSLGSYLETHQNSYQLFKSDDFLAFLDEKQPLTQNRLITGDYTFDTRQVCFVPLSKYWKAKANGDKYCREVQ